MSKKVFFGATAALAAVVAALTATVSDTKEARAESSASAVLTPVVDTASDIAYRYFDAPSYVHADSSGVYVTDKDAVITVAKTESGMDFSERDGISADKVKRFGDLYIALCDGAISSYYGSDAPTVYSGINAVDFDIFGETVYAIGENSLASIPLTDSALSVSEATVVTLASSDYETVRATAIAAHGENAYITLRSASSKSRQDIVKADTATGRLNIVHRNIDDVMSVDIMDHSDVLYVLTRDRITGYDIASDSVRDKYVSQDARMKSICAYDGFIYALDTLGAVYKISGDLQTYTPITASASSAVGFFDTPNGATVKNSALYVADTANNRVARYADKPSYVDGKFYEPVSVACDSRGVLYVAHDGNKVSTGGTTVAVDGFIKQIAVNADKRLFISADTGLWTTDDGEAVKLSDAEYTAITLGVGRDDLYALSGSTVYKATDVGGNLETAAYCEVPSGSFSIAVDFKGNVFALSRSSVSRIDMTGATPVTTEFPLTLDGAPYSMGFTSGQILLSTVENAFVGYGDAVIVDTAKHRVFTADGSASGLGIKLIDEEDYDVPDEIHDKTPEFYGAGLIRTALYDVPVFSLPIETPELYVIEKGRNVIVPQYDLADTREYSFILIDDKINDKLIQGYVYKDALSAALPYEAPPADIATVYAAGTPIYKWPSPNSQTISGYSPADPDDGELKMLDFVQTYRDYRNNIWYRISVGDNYEGFIMQADIIIGEYEVSTIRPAYNAVIISYKHSTFAPAYILKDGKYSSIDIDLNTGTKVEVVGTFDTSEKYTKIKCLTERGTVTCYVETVYIEYNGVNIVLIVAIVVIIITVILAAIIICRIIYLKKKRLTSPSDDADDTDR